MNREILGVYSSQGGQGGLWISTGIEQRWEFQAGQTASAKALGLDNARPIQQQGIECG